MGRLGTLAYNQRAYSITSSARAKVLGAREAKRLGGLYFVVAYTDWLNATTSSECKYST
jgi:hypothetical protein